MSNNYYHKWQYVIEVKTDNKHIEAAARGIL